jgi:hypothetical protein
LHNDRAMTDRLAAALAALSDADLEVLRELAREAHGPTAGLLAAIEHAAHLAWHRRRGVNFEVLRLGDAIVERYPKRRGGLMIR